jgi:hypothetical protein
MKNKGTTLVEVVIAVGILAILSLALYSAFNFFFQVLAQKKYRVNALAIANEKMEIIRNLTFNDIGTVSGIPSGSIPQTETVNRNNVNFTVQTQIAYIDDPFDGTLDGSPNDLLPTDYKRIRIAVSWPSRFTVRPVTLISDIAPRGIESTVNGGTLAITVFNANGQPVEGASVNIVNNSTNPTINITTQTNSQGKTTFPGAPASNDSYAITVTKAGYSTDQTYPRTTQMPNPLKPHATVLNQDLTEVSFAIDLLSTLNIYTYTHTFVNNWRVNSYTGDADQYYPSLASDSSGNLYFCWQDDRQSNNNRIYAQKYNSSLTRQWSSSDVRISNANNQSHSSMAGDASGNTYIAWQDDSNGNQDVYVLKITPTGGTGWTGSKKINTDATSADQTLPQIVLNGNNIYITWTDYRNTHADVYLHKIDINKNYIWGSERKVNSDTTNTNQLASRLIAINRTVGEATVEEIYVVWTDYRNTNADIYLQKIDPDGNKLWVNDLKVNSDSTTTDQLSPALASDGGNVFVTWSDNRGGNADIYLQKIDPDGNKLWVNDLLASSDGSANAITPALVINNSQVYLAWIDNRNDNNDLYSQTFDLDGNKIWSSDLKINDDLTGADQEQPQMIVNPSGQVIYAWVDDRNGNYDLYASGTGTTIPTPWGNIALTIRGSKKISNSPSVYKYSQNFTTNAQGELSLPNMEWDTYTITVSGGRIIKNADPGLPLELSPNVTQTLKLYLD